MKILLAFMSCNRLHYLRNCVSSILEFIDLDDAEVLVVDNGSTENGMVNYLNEIQNKVTIKRFEDRVPHELYRAMNYVIKYCRKHKISVVNFIQDDYQFLFHRDGILDEVRDILNKHSDVGQINSNLLWKRKYIKWSKSKKKAFKTVKARRSKVNYAILSAKWFRLCDGGFTRTSIYKKIGLYPKAVSYDQDYKKTKGFGKKRYKKNLNGEMWFQSKCYRLGLKRSMCLFPNMGMMSSCAYVRGNLRFGDYFSPPNDYYLKILDEAQQESIGDRCNKKKFSFIEDWAIPDGWEPHGPGKHDIYSNKQEEI